MAQEYVLLTGSKGNAGDFLIKYRAKQLFSYLRPETKITDLNGWEKLTPEKLALINNSKALLLTGGPALQQHMYPSVYGLTENLTDIKVPIITVGIGYKDQEGSWERTKNYLLSDKTLLLLDKIAESGYISGVRDYHTLNVLMNRGFSNFVMTGCPALYDINYIGKKFIANINISKIIFSTGVSYIESESMFQQTIELIESIISNFPESQLKILFHHTINRKNKKQDQLIKWMEKNKIDFADISGSESKLIEEYSNCDLHIGYRVHAHIFMCSMSRPSILLNEDSRGKGLQLVIGSLHFDTYKMVNWNFTNRILRKLNIKFDKIIAIPGIAKDLINNIQYEISNEMPRIKSTRRNIDANYEVIKNFIKNLP